MAARLKVLLIYPRFPALTFWNYKATCEVSGARYPAAPLGLITVAAMLPAHWEMRLIDRNVEELDEHDIRSADIVMTGGMLPQQLDTLALIDLCKSLGSASRSVARMFPRARTSTPPPISGSSARPKVSSTISSAHLRRGRAAACSRPRNSRSTSPRSPIPRFGLLKFNQYLHVGVQFSRGCPFTCEFCDIIELYGRVPRAKTNDQMLAELTALHESGYRG